MHVELDLFANVTEASLIAQGISQPVAKVRIEHIGEKRFAKAAMLENNIRNGRINQLQIAQNFISLKDPSKIAQKINNSYSRSYSYSDFRVGIPLREPLDPELRLHRKLAK